MSKQSIKATINANIKQNGVQAITGQIMNSVLNGMVDNLAAEDEVVKQTSQTLTPAVQAQVRQNIGAIGSSELDEVSDKVAELEGEMADIKPKVDAIIDKDEHEDDVTEQVAVDWETNTFYPTSGKKSTSTSYQATSLIEVQEGDVITALYNTSARGFRYVCAYADGTAVSAKGATSAANYVVPEGINGVRLTFETKSTNVQYISVFRTRKITTTEYSLSDTAKNGLINDWKGFFRKDVRIYLTDTQREIYDKMKMASDTGNMDVYFECGKYNITEELYDVMKSEFGWSVGFELPIGGGCRYFFNGATIIGSYGGTDSAVHENCNVIGCRRTSGNFELHDGTIIAEDIVYCVHDDVGERGDFHVHKYDNMHLIYNGGTFASGNYICKCIGGGTGLNQTIVIDGCVLEKYTSNSDKACVTYHGHSNAPAAPTKSRIVITNTYMTGSCGAYHKAASREMETIELYVSNCVTTSITHNDVDAYAAWNNVTPSSLSDTLLLRN